MGSVSTNSTEHLNQHQKQPSFKSKPRFWGTSDWHYRVVVAKYAPSGGWYCWTHSLKLLWVTSHQAYFATHRDSVLGLPTIPRWAGEDHTQNNLINPRGWTETLVNTWNRARADRFPFFAEESFVLCRWPRFEWEERIQFLPRTVSR